MSTAHQRTAFRICEAALERPMEARAAYIAEACGDDDTLRREVESLLAQSSRADAFIETPALEMDFQREPDPRLTIGQRIGIYQVVAWLGAGGMGEVYRAHDTELGRDVALKVLPPTVLGDPDRLTRFEREARVLAALNHPNVGAIYGLANEAGVRALVLELVEGVTLAEKLANSRSGALPVTEALTVARQIADALEAAHEKGIIHRDLKPANVVITLAGVVKVLDFGLAKLAAVDGAPSALNPSQSPTITASGTRSGLLLGTARYMSPEQARGQAVDKRTDIWAFGCVLFEMLTGQPAFPGVTVTDTLVAIVDRNPDWTALPAATPASVRRLLRRCLEKDQKGRLPDIVAARLEIHDAQSEPAQASLVTPTPRRAWLAWTVAVVALLGSALAVWMIARPRVAPPNEAHAMRFEIALPENTKFAPMGGFAASPDGRQLVFAATGVDNVTRLWVRALDATEAKPLPGTEGSALTGNLGDRPFWSPDSRFVAFRVQGNLKRIDVSGGPAQDISGVATCLLGCWPGSWSHDGVILFTDARDPVIKRVSAAGGTPVPVTLLDPSRQEYAHVLPEFLPDGRHFLFSRRSRVAGSAGVYIGDLNAKPDEQGTTSLVDGPFGATYVPPATGPGPGDIVFQRADGTLMAQPFDDRTLTLSGEPRVVAERVGRSIRGGFLSVSRTGVLVYRSGSLAENSILTWVDRQGNTLGRLGAPAPYSGLALSPDGTRVAVAEEEVLTGAHDIWLLEIGTGRRTRLTFGPERSDWPIWSPDSRLLVFASPGRGPTRMLFQVVADGSTKPEALAESGDLPDGLGLNPTGWSPDGRFLLFSGQDATTGSRDLFLLPMPHDRPAGEPDSKTRAKPKPIPFLRTPFNENDPVFSPDGRWVAYDSDESGRGEIYVRRFSPSAPIDQSARWLVSNGSGDTPSWRGDGKEIFYYAPDPDGTVMAVSVTPGSSFQVGTPTPLFKLSRAGSLGGFVAAVADGRRFLVEVPEQQDSRPLFTVVLNWQAGLKK
jgi:serine/threonine protein kinase/Tol biopolymer transport system component